MYIYTVIMLYMKIRYVESHRGYLLDERGCDSCGEFVKVPALLRDGEVHYSRYRGVIDAHECGSFQRVKLVGFTAYSLNGKDWIQLRDMYEHVCVVGVRKLGEYYIMLFDGKPRFLEYAPKQEKRYTNNVFDIKGSHRRA